MAIKPRRVDATHTLWNKLSPGGHLTERQALSPGLGVWIQTETIPGDFQHTVEHIALNGDNVRSIHCYHGQGRSAALRLAVELAISQ